jgi:hypothetical protein
MKPLTLLQGCGVSAFVLFRLYGSSIAHPSDLRMHTPVPLTNFALSIIANLVLAGIIFAFLGQWIGRSRKLKWLRFLLPGALLALLVKVVGINVDAIIHPPFLIAICLGTTLAAGMFQRKLQRGEQIASNLTAAVLLGMGIFFFFVVVQLAHLAMWRPAPNLVDNLPAANAGGSNHPRIVWILFDELSYQQTFGDRFPNLRLPNFDSLRKSSTIFTDARPVANYTELAIPSILLGSSVVRTNYTFHNQFQVIEAGKHSFRPFDAGQTPFARAQRQGLTMGVVGWYNPYCGMLAPYLNLCFWTNEEEVPLIFGIRDGFWKDLASPWLHYIKDAFSPTGRKRLAARRVDTYQDLLQHSNEALEKPNLDFIFLHLPLPHPPGFYNRETQQFDASGNRSYVDNLALADKTLGQLLAVLEHSPRWKDTDVIVCGDHSWRPWFWSPTPSWTAEDQTASQGGVYDPRPVLMVHMAGQTMPATVTAPYPLLQVHDILDDLIEGKKPLFPHH